MITFYRPFDEPVLCCTSLPVLVQGCAPRWREIGGEPQLIACSHLTIPDAQVAVICPARSIQFGPDVTPETSPQNPLVTLNNLDIPWGETQWLESLAPEPWPEPPPQ